MSSWIRSTVWPVSAAQQLLHPPLEGEDLAGADLDVGGLALEPLVWPWWIIIFELGSAIRLPRVPPASRIAPIDIAMPKQIVRTSG